MGPPVETEERVRYSETDQMGVAHNKSYFEWFEIGRTEFCRRKGIPYREIEAQGFYLVVVDYEILTKGDCHLVASGYTVHIATTARGEVSLLPKLVLDKISAE
jgi:acyl-CoA thioester hydrolase